MQQEAQTHQDENIDLTQYTVEQLRAFLDHHTDGLPLLAENTGGFPEDGPDDLVAQLGTSDYDIIWDCWAAGFGVYKPPGQTSFYIRELKEPLDTDYTEL